MPRAEKGSRKDVANKMKAKGLGRLRWYCQVCEKQCRDENGFKCHAQSEGHLRAMLAVGKRAGSQVAQYSNEFERNFMQILSRRYGTTRVKANNVYQEVISDKHHTHMNATRWVTMTEFCFSMARAGKMKVEDTEKGLFITWVDTTPKTLSKQAANQLRERMDMDDEQRQAKMIEEQIQRARAAEEAAGPVASGSGTSEAGNESDSSAGPSAPISIGLSLAKKPSASPVPESPTESSASPPPPLKINPLKAKSNPLKAGNAFKAATPAPTSIHSNKRPLSALEQIVQEEEERKKRRAQSTWSGERGHGASGLQRRD